MTGFIENILGLSAPDHGCNSPLDMVKKELDTCGYYSQEVQTNLNVFHAAVRERLLSFCEPALMSVEFV